MLLHKIHDLAERRLLGDGDDLRGHDVIDAAAMRAHIIRRPVPGADQQTQEAEMAVASACLDPPQQVALRQDADEFAIACDHWNAAYPVDHHDVDGGVNRRK